MIKSNSEISLLFLAFNLFSFDSGVQVKRSCYFTEYQFRRPTTYSGLYNVIVIG